MGNSLTGLDLKIKEVATRIRELSEIEGMSTEKMAQLTDVSEPLYVKCAYSSDAEHKDIELTTHAGQEFDIVISGTLKVQIGSHKEILHEGDAVYYDSSTPHGMIALYGKDCEFYAIVLSAEGEKPDTNATPDLENPTENKPHQPYRRIYRNFIHPKEDENGALIAVDFENEDKFNFAFDVVDALADKRPDKLAMLHLNINKN
ncbi:MAG: cupin domain-containing protein [Firmicutes bacterium]|nr:cupin domain-containing protein [Bacillota bacterium]